MISFYGYMNRCLIDFGDWKLVRSIFSGSTIQTPSCGIIKVYQATMYVTICSIIQHRVEPSAMSAVIHIFTIFSLGSCADSVNFGYKIGASLLCTVL